MRDADFLSRLAMRGRGSGDSMRDYLFVDVGANKGYLVSSVLGLWSPISGISPRSCYAVLHDLTGGHDPGCGVCSDCKESVPAAVLPPVDAAWLAAHSNIALFAVEPQPSNFDLILGLAANWSGAGTPGASVAMVPCQLALADYEGIATMEERGRGDEGSSIGNENLGSGPTFKVRVTTLDALVASDIDPLGRFIYDGVFIDAEGYDPAVIDGALETLVYTRTVVFEYASWITTHPRLKLKKRYLAEVVDKMDAVLGFNCYLTWGEELFRLTGCWHPSFETFSWSNILCANRRDPVSMRVLETLATIWQE